MKQNRYSQKRRVAELFRLSLLLMLAFLIAGCSNVVETPGVPQETIPPVTTSPTVTPTAGPIQPELLTVCLGQEPASLFIYADSSNAAKSVYQAIYDGPIDRISYEEIPVILEDIPSLQNTGVRFEAVQINPGDLISTSDGEWTTLQEGVSYYPNGCTSDACQQVYSGTEPVTIDQMVVRFSFKPGLLWSDGTPLTAADSVYSYEVARSLYPSYLPELIAATDSYTAIDETSVEWRGLAGYRGGSPSGYFFHPLPKHSLGTTDAQQLLASETASRFPLGWGPYRIDSWVQGDHILLKKNPNYFRASENLPPFESLVFRFVDSSTSAIDALLSGECDLADETSFPTDQRETIARLLSETGLNTYIHPDTGWEQISFGIQPFDPARPAPFASKEVRQAAAYCIDRESLIGKLNLTGAKLMHSYLPAEHPGYSPEVHQYPYDPAKGAELLESAGWLDSDSDPGTPRTAMGVSGIPAGNSLKVSYLVPEDAEHQEAAAFVQENLQACGFDVEIVSMEWQELLAAGPEGPVFGRNFDMAQFGWAAVGEANCSLFLSSEIPGLYPEYPKGWGGANLSGYSNQEFDQACRTSLLALTEQVSGDGSGLSALEFFATDLPALPLYTHYGVFSSRSDLCRLMVETTGTDALWNLEAINYGDFCNE
ncbi:MAG: hypothetical protein EHM41_07440 [Chloroflexi bacterium]|nr:MAG: hypothetical protein EHM41_07440 [Chloroflexota bacterium]